MPAVDVLFLLYLIGFLPYAALRGARRARLRTVSIAPTGRRQLGTLIMHAMSFFLAYMAARADGVALSILAPDPVAAIPWTIAFVAMCAAWLVTRWRATPAPSDAVLPPETVASHGPREAFLRVITSCSASVVEEYVYRGVGTTILAWYAGGLVPASMICAAAFGVAHAAQGKCGMLITFVFALSAQALVHVTGALGPAMLVHALYDIAAGWVLAKKYPRAIRELKCV